VGNKIDLAERREVTTSEGQELAAKYKCLFLESSAKQNINVIEAFQGLVREIKRDKEIRGYNLPKSKGPDESMRDKIAKKFAKWNVLEAAKKQFNKFFGKDKKDKVEPKSKSGTTSHIPSTNAPSSTQNNSYGSNTYNPSNSNPSPSFSQPSNTARPSVTDAPRPVQQEAPRPVQQEAPRPVQQEAPRPKVTQVPTPFALAMQDNKGGFPALKTTQSPHQQNGPPMKSSAPMSKANVQTAPVQATPKNEHIESDLASWMQEINSGPDASDEGVQAAPSSLSSSNKANPASKYGTIPKAAPADLDFSKYDFFHGKISGSDVNTLLAGKPIGTFLARYSSQPSHLAVSYVLDASGAIQSVLVGYDSSGIWMADGDPELVKYPALLPLIKDYDNVLQQSLAIVKPSSLVAVKDSFHYSKIPPLSGGPVKKNM